MRNIDCLICLDGLRSVDAPNMEPRFNYAVAKNIRLLGYVERDLEEARKVPEEYQQFLADREEINQKYAEKDENGVPKKVSVPGAGKQPMWNYVIKDIADPNSKYNKEIEALKKKYETVIQARDKQVDSYNDLLQEENEDIKLHMVDLDLVPKGLSRKAMDAVMYFIRDDEPAEMKVKKPKD